MFLRQRHLFRQMVDAFTMEFNHFPRTRPNALAAVRAALVDDPYLGFKEFDGVLGTHTDAATAEIAFPGDQVDHQWRRARQSNLFNHCERIKTCGCEIAIYSTPTKHNCQLGLKSMPASTLPN